jgi:hypothetical protein
VAGIIDQCGRLQTDLGPSIGLGPSLVPQFVGPQGPGLALEPERDLAADHVPPGAVAVVPGGGLLHLQTDLGPSLGLGPSLSLVP